MALFKFRKGGGDEPMAAGAPQPESVEALRRRARHRLIGAVVLVLAGVAGFPLLFDTQPRPISVDIPIDIPDRNKVKPLPVPVAPPARPVASGAAAPPPSAPVVAAAPPPPAPAPAPAPAAPKPEPVQPQQQAKAEPKPEPKPEPKAEARPPAPAPRVDEAAKAQALLEGRTVPAAEGRFVVQVGAFSDTGKAQETRKKVERAGLKTYTQVAETKDGKRIRVRVGPFATRADADKAAQKIKGLDLPAAILTL
ncbi:MAG: SPOR domain-containing protein [Pseudomonadota bacterium]